MSGVHIRTVQVPVVVWPKDVVECSSHADILDFICAVDQKVGDAGFTERLISRLVSSLQADITDEEWAEVELALIDLIAAGKNEPREGGKS